MIKKDFSGTQLIPGRRYYVYIVQEDGGLAHEMVATWNGSCFIDDEGYATDIGEELFGVEVAFPELNMEQINV